MKASAIRQGSAEGRGKMITWIEDVLTFSEDHLQFLSNVIPGQVDNCPG
jgi:hypothetical protein